MKLLKKYYLLVVVIFFLTVSIAAYAATPQTINYQGYLTDSGGNPVNGMVSMTLRIYNVASGGTSLWTETQATIQVSNGIYDIILGLVTPINLSFDEQYYLGVEVGTDGEMMPRQQLTGVPYAMRAKEADNANTLGGQSAAGFASSGHKHDSTDITTGTVAEAHIDSAITRDSEIMPTVLANIAQIAPAVLANVSEIRKNPAANSEDNVPKCYVVFSYDDCFDSDYDEMWLKVFQPQGEKMTSFCPAAWVGSNNNVYMNWGELQALQSAGNEIGYHGYDHTTLSRLSDSEIKTDIERSLALFNANNINAKTAAYPGGGGTSRTNYILGQYFRAARGIEFTSGYWSVNSVEEPAFMDNFYIMGLGNGDASRSTVENAIRDCVAGTNSGGQNDYYGKLIVVFDHETNDCSASEDPQWASCPVRQSSGVNCTKSSSAETAKDDVCGYNRLIDIAQEYEKQGLLEITTLSKALDNLSPVVSSGQSQLGNLGAKVSDSLLIRGGSYTTDWDCTGSCSNGRTGDVLTKPTNESIVSYCIEMQTNGTFRWDDDARCSDTKYYNKTSCEAAGKTWTCTDGSWEGSDLLVSTPWNALSNGLEITMGFNPTAGNIYTFTSFPKVGPYFSIEDPGRTVMFQVNERTADGKPELLLGNGTYFNTNGTSTVWFQNNGSTVWGYNGNSIILYDDKKYIFGTGSDFSIGFDSTPGSGRLKIVKGSNLESNSVLEFDFNTLAVNIPPRESAPGSCTVGDEYRDSSDGITGCICTSTNTWTKAWNAGGVAGDCN